ncbi:spore maturation protein [Mucisphaera sp.]|uniref:spore maturation protein n=1 Tax=Mucisphaera sp. TaxID=2913024 RepID=UPI003D151D40
MIDFLREYASDFGIIVVLFMMVGFPLIGIIRGVNVYEEFVTGAKEGFEIAVMIIPYLVAILFAIGMLRASGGMETIAEWLRPAFEAIGIPPEVLPMAITRPLTGGGSVGVLGDMVNNYGVDSIITKISAVIFGSTETTFYVIAVYFGAVGIKKIRHAALVGLTADICAIILAIYIVQWLNG